VGQYPPQYVSGDSLVASHHYMTDAVAALDGVVLPYSYAGAKLLKDGTFKFNFLVRLVPDFRRSEAHAGAENRL